jgi:hypothetical protein
MKGDSEEDQGFAAPPRLSMEKEVTFVILRHAVVGRVFS